MTDRVGQDSAPAPAAPLPPEAPSVPVWAQATLADVTDFAFEAPVAGSKSASGHDLTDAFQTAMKAAKESASPDERAARVFAMLAGVTSMHHRPADRNAPYGAMMQWEDKRTAIPEDFRGEPVAALAYMAERATHPVLRARLSDVAWLLDRKRHQLAGIAIGAYVETINRVRTGELPFKIEGETVLSRRSAELLRRALQIARAQDWDGPEAVAARTLTDDLRKQSVAEKARTSVNWFSDLDLDFTVSDPAVVAADIESAMQGSEEGDGRHPYVSLELWRLAARGYFLAKRETDQHRCQLAAAECQVAQAEQIGSAMLGSHWMSAAIAELHGIPGQADRRKALRHRLVDLQAGVSEELSSFTQEIDLTAIIEGAKAAVEPLSLSDSLFAFAGLSQSPDPAELVETAIESIREYPFSSVFGMSLMDAEGKVVHRSPGGDFSGSASDPAVAQQISQQERIRRQLAAHGSIETARRVIVGKHYVSDDTLRPLIESSPFVPNDLVATFARGFARFFQGDFTSAVYTLTPLLENSLRHVLKLNGIDVTTFDDAGQTQEDRSIASLFDQMRPDLDDVFSKPITTDIENVFLTKQGPALRHGVAHGLLHDGSPYGPDAIYACWLIFRLCIIPLARHRSEFKSLIPS